MSLPFVTTIPGGKKLYRSSGDLARVQNGTWYGLNLDDTLGYGSVRGEFVTKKDLRLIDVTSQEFYNNYVHKLNNSIHDLELKLTCLFPLGYTDHDTYLKRARKYIPSTYCLTHPPYSERLMELGQFFANRSRCSIMQNDVAMMQVLKALYISDSDGIISPVTLPNKPMNGTHHPEIALYDNNNVQFVGEIQNGGGCGGVSKTPWCIIGTDLAERPEFKHRSKGNPLFDKSISINDFTPEMFFTGVKMLEEQPKIPIIVKEPKSRRKTRRSQR